MLLRMRPVWSDGERRHFRWCLSLSALLFLLCAAFTSFHHWDEYFQIIEPVSSKLGRTDPANLTWDFQEKMRSWLQPAIYVGIARAAAGPGIDRPMTLLLVFRLLTGLIGWVSLWSLIVRGRHFIEREQERCRLYSIAAFLWLVPYFGVRTSSETMATSALCFGVALLEYRTEVKGTGLRLALAAFAGAALGLCFEFRYASAAMAAIACASSSRHTNMAVMGACGPVTAVVMFTLQPPAKLP